MLLRTFAAIIALSLPVLASARDAELELPSFRHLQDKAVETVDITIDGWPLRLAAALVDNDENADVATKELIRGLKSISIRSYSFNADNSYSRRDVDAVRRQLKQPEWLSLAQMRSTKEDSHVDIFVSMDGDKPRGLAIVATEPREFTIVNIVGTVEPEHLGKIGRHFHLRALNAHTDSED